MNYPHKFPSVIPELRLWQLILPLIFLNIFSPLNAEGSLITNCKSHGNPKITSAGWTFTSLPVGHGDAHVIESPDGNITVVDAGSTETVDTLVEFLDRRDINRIHRLVVTHPHWDHIGGVATLLDRYRVNKILRPGLEHATDLVKKTNEKITSENPPVRYLARGDTFILGDEQTAFVVNPGDDSSGGLNQNSLVFYADVGRTTLLMMGDVFGSREAELLNRGLVPDADILKVAHHGNADGTSRRLLRTVDPSMAVLPAPLRKNDPWGKPDPALVDRLQEFGVPTFHTGRVGTVDVRFDTNAIRTVRLGRVDNCLPTGS